VQESTGDISEQYWALIGLSCKFNRYIPFQPVCFLGDVANDIHFLIKGELLVLFNRSVDINEERLENGDIPIIKSGNSLGDIGVLYGHTR